MNETNRRKHKRRKVLDSFSIFAHVPSKSIARLPVHDLSEGGMAFDLDIPGELASAFNVKNGDELDVQLYLNQSLYIPLRVRIARIENQKQGMRLVGTEFVAQEAKPYQAFVAFLTALDGIAAVLPG